MLKTRGALLKLLFGGLLLAAGTVQAEQLPIRTYTTADGLAQDNVNRIVRDSRGFLWFCTGEGLSRFDGYQFVSYTTDQGLPHRQVNDFLETRGGNYWVATSGGLCRLNPAGARLFTVVKLPGEGSPPSVETLAQDQAGVVWCGTHHGLYRLEEAGGDARLQFVEAGMPSEAEGDVVQSLLADRQGSLWIGTRGSGLYRRLSSGGIEHYTDRDGLPSNRVEALLEDRGGRLWVAASDGLCELVDSPDPRRSLVAHKYSARDGLAANWVSSVFQSADGHLWVGAHGGLSELVPADSREAEEAADSREARVSRPVGGVKRAEKPGLPMESGIGHLRTYTMDNGLSAADIQALTEDSDGNLWIGVSSGGAMKLARSGFTTYTEADGLCAAAADSVVQDRAGEICAINRDCISRFDGLRFTTIRLALPRHIRPGWGWNQIALQDQAGEWWVPTGQGVCRFPAVKRVEQLATTAPKSVYNDRNGLPYDEVFRLYEDRRGDIWISTLSPNDNGLTRWDRKSERLVTVSGDQAHLRANPADAFGEDAAGNLWIGHWGGGLTRYTGGRFEFFGEADGLPAGTIRALFLDDLHRLWLASSQGGLARIDDPAAIHPRFVAYTTAEGLSSDDVWCITEDQWGHIYAGTGRGLDRLDPETGYVRHYTVADGLARGQVRAVFRDSHGALWICTNVHGLSRLIPRPDPPQTPPPIMISGLRIAGAAYPVSQLGETELPALDLAPSQNQLNIDFLGLSFGAGEVLRYQYQLEGADKDWSAPSDQRSVNYARLAPGHYRFLVRAVNAEGLSSAAPASIAFTVQPPVWRQWWFLMLAAIIVGLAAYVAYRARVVRLVELERVRTRIATDLHDDIGANLSLIAMVSEVARGHVQRDDHRMKEWFSTIASTSRDTVDAMSDIVWAVNPRRDQLSDLTLRMRRFADDIFDARDITVDFRAHEPGRNPKVGADLRREVYLIFKESINNMVRHSRCSAAEVDMQIDHGWLVLRMSDNGSGFDGAITAEGNGLASMRHRAAKLGGSLDLISSNGRGTSVTLRVPLGSRGKH